MPYDRTAFGRAALLLLAIGFAGLFAIAGTSLWLAGRSRAYADLVTREQQARANTGQILSLLRDAETGQRGYLLTDGDPAYLAPYRNAQADLPAHLSALQAAEAGDPALRNVAAALVSVAGAKMAEMGRTVALQTAGQHAAALAVVRTGTGKALMDRARTLLGTVVDHDEDNLSAASLSLKRSSARQLAATLAAALLIALVAAGAVWTVARYTRELDGARREIEEANAGLEARVRERTASLEQANEEVQRFAYIVSHDLRAPLVNIMGFTAELEHGHAALASLVAAAEARAPELVTPDARTAIAEDMPEAIGFIRSSTDRMDRLINAILRISREGRRSLTPESVDLNELFARILPTVQHQLVERDATLGVENRLPGLISDRLALEQVFGNLIDNAVKYLDPARPGRITVRGRRERHGIVIEVEDNGRGIAESDLERIFELFRRAGAQTQAGEGIGLAHVRALLRRLGGTIACESRLGEGSIFRVGLPRTPAASSGTLKRELAA